MGEVSRKELGRPISRTILELFYRVGLHSYKIYFILFQNCYVKMQKIPKKNKQNKQTENKTKLDPCLWSQCPGFDMSWQRHPYQVLQIYEAITFAFTQTFKYVSSKICLYQNSWNILIKSQACKGMNYFLLILYSLRKMAHWRKSKLFPWWRSSR